MEGVQPFRTSGFLFVQVNEHHRTVTAVISSLANLGQVGIDITTTDGPETNLEGSFQLDSIFHRCKIEVAKKQKIKGDELCESFEFSGTVSVDPPLRQLKLPAGAVGRRDGGRGEEGTIINVIRAAVMAHSERIALVYRGSSHVTYASMWWAVVGLCARLKMNTARDPVPQNTMTCEEQEIVGLCMDKGLDSIVGIIAIMKSSKIYCPIDPEWPVKRMQSAAATANMSRILVSKRYTSEQARMHLESVGLELVDVDVEILLTSALNLDSPLEEKHTNENGEQQEEEEEVVDSKHTAYCIFTSGSTGEPKGVVVTHSGIPFVARGQAQEFDVTAGSRCLSFYSLTFDASLSEIFVPLAVGATLFLEKRESVAPSEKLIDLLNIRRITHCDLPPAFLPVLSASRLIGWLECVVVGGEKTSDKAILEWTKHHKHLKIVNAYGPTETTICATTHQLDGVSPNVLGKPLPGYQVFLVDPVDQTVVELKHSDHTPNTDQTKVGREGEICIAGVGLARGYLGDVDATSEKFVVDVRERGNDSESAGSVRLMYRTGDWGRVVGNSIEFLRRIEGDGQIKIRGLRIELGEVESALTLHDDVTAAVVLARPIPLDSGGTLTGETCGETSEKEKEKENHDQQLHLVAYVTLRPERTDSPLTLEGWRSFLSEHIPSYMIPSHFVVLEAFPMSDNGAKIDVSKLPLPSTSRVFSSTRFVQPTTNTQRTMAQLWEEILKCGPVGVNDNVWDLGCNSLSAIQFVSAIGSRGVVVSPQACLQYPTIRQLADYVDNHQPAAPQGHDGTSDGPGGEVSYSARQSELLSHARVVEFESIVKMHDKGASESHIITDAVNEVALPSLTLLTGASGFLGGAMLMEMVMRKDNAAPVCCIVRGRDINHSAQRLAEKLQLLCSLWQVDDEPHVIPIDESMLTDKVPLQGPKSAVFVMCGDVSMCQFGLSAKEWQFLQSRVTDVYHCAADVNLVRGFDELFDVNVGATLQCLHLGHNSRKRATVHIISSLAIYLMTDRNIPNISEQTPLLDKSSVLYGGYAQTKWLSDYVASLAGKGSYVAGGVRVYRVGLVTGHTHLPYINQDDMFSRVLRQSKHITHFPLVDGAMDVSPVDVVATAVVTLGGIACTNGFAAYHLANPHSLSARDLITLLNTVRQEVGRRPMEFCDAQQWYLRVMKGTDSYMEQPSGDGTAGDADNDGAGTAGVDPELLLLLPLFSESRSRAVTSVNHRSMDLFLATGSRLQCEVTLTALRECGASVFFPAPDVRLIRHYLQISGGQWSE